MTLEFAPRRTQSLRLGTSMKLGWFSACPACPKPWVLLPPALYNALRTAFRNLTEKNQEFKVPQPHRNFKANMSYRRLSFQKEEKKRGKKEGRELWDCFSMKVILWLFVIATKDRTQTHFISFLPSIAFSMLVQRNGSAFVFYFTVILNTSAVIWMRNVLHRLRNLKLGTQLVVLFGKVQPCCRKHLTAGKL